MPRSAAFVFSIGEKFGLGTGGEHVDVLAHLFGFLFGGVLGLFFAFVPPAPPGRLVQSGCGSAALAVLIYCWILALR